MITRRKFIGTTALAAGAFAFVPSTFKSKDADFNKPNVIAAIKN